MGTSIPIQTIESAVRSDTGEVVLASDLLTMTEQAFTEFRRATWPPTKRPEHPGPQLTFRCTLCDAPLTLSRLRKFGKTKNRFFIHRRPIDEDCPWLHRNRLTAAQVQAMQYFGQHEGELHRRIKYQIADAMSSDQDTEPGSVIVDKFQIGKILRGERKRPDVRATWRDKAVVFEIQFSYTFISEVVKRDYFYANEGSFLIWVFSTYSPERAVVMDEEFHNRRNVFVFDLQAQSASQANAKLMLWCYYTLPVLNEPLREIEERQECKLITLADLSYPAVGLRPYYIDCDALREEAERKLRLLQDADRAEQEQKVKEEAQLRQQRQAEARQREVDEVARRVKVAQSAERSIKATESAGDEVWRQLAELGKRRNTSVGEEDTTALKAAIESLSDPERRRDAQILLRYPYLDTAFKLISIQTGQPHGTKFRAVFEILAASLQEAPGEETRQKHMAFLYLAAVEAYRPAMRPEQHKTLLERETFHRAEAARDPDFYVTEPDFLRTVRWLFPGLAAALDAQEWRDIQRGSPGLQWRAAPDKTKVASVGKRYLTTHPKTDWRSVYSAAKDARERAQDVASLIEQCAAQTGARPGDIRNFLVASTLVTSNGEGR